MSLSKLRITYIAIIGAAVCVIIGLAMYFLVISKANARLEAATKTRDQFQPTGTPQNIKKQKDAYANAIATVAAEQAKFDRYMSRKMPVLDFSDRESGLMALWYEQSTNLGPTLVRWLHKANVTVNDSTRITIPAPIVNPNDLISDPLTPITIPLGKITVKGSFPQIVKHIKQWNEFNRLVMVDNVSLKGISPELECTYDATLYIFPTRPADPANKVEMAGAQGAAAGAPGATAGTVPAVNPQSPTGPAR